MSKRYGSAKVNGGTLRALMRKSGIFPDELSEQAHMGLRVVQKMMGGGNCNLEFIRRAAEVLNADVSTLTSFDPPRSSNPPPIIEGTISFSGIAENSSPQLLGTLATELADLLKSHGISVTSYQCQIALQDITDSVTRIIVLVYGFLNPGKPFWCYVAVKPSKYALFMASQKAGDLNLYDFDPFGEIIVSGEGTDPPSEITAKVAEVYKADVNDFSKKAN